jgi:hypothetical protein
MICLYMYCYIWTLYFEEAVLFLGSRVCVQKYWVSYFKFSIMLLITWEKSYLFYCPSLHLAAPSVIPPPYSTPYMEPGNYVLLCLINSLTKTQLIKEEAPPDQLVLLAYVCKSCFHAK